MNLLFSSFKNGILKLNKDTKQRRSIDLDLKRITSLYLILGLCRMED